MIVVFYLSAFVAVVASALVVTSFNAIHALLYLVVSFLAIALVFFVLGAPFAAALEIIIYSGAILVLFVFVIMIISPGPRYMAQERAWFSLRTWFLPVILVAVLGAELIYLLTITSMGRGGSVISAGDVGLILLGPYLVGVEIASLLLLAGLIGAFHLGHHSAWHRERCVRRSEGENRQQSHGRINAKSEISEEPA